MSVTWDGLEREMDQKWPDLSRDREAWEQAKRELGEGADLRDVAQLAQTIKENL
jgi:hypothetical protein